MIRALDLRPHPEGGHYRETWRDTPADGTRGVGTSILFLLAAGEASHWHRVNAAELWIWQAGAPLALRCSPGAGVTLGRSLGAWSLVCCVVTPAFRFAGFELAPPGWEPAQE